jgi:undecaprenyl-diphosphatase
MNVSEAVILGIVQGLGEFLPISSSAHLILAPWLFGWKDPGLAFDVALHFGTLLAVLLYFGKDWITIVLEAFGWGERDNSTRGGFFPRGFLWMLALATIPGALTGYFFEHYAEAALRNPLLIAATLSGLGLILYMADKACGQKKSLSQVSWNDAILIGLAQALAIIPGISRAGSTITVARLLGMDRVSAARFSFFLSTPIILGASMLKLKAFFEAGIGWPEVTGIVTSAVVGYLAIASLIRYVGEVSYRVFFWYRLALALLIVAVWMGRL